MFSYLQNLMSGGQKRGYEELEKSLRGGFGQQQDAIRQGMGEARQYGTQANQALQGHANINMQQLQDYINSYQKMANPKEWMDKTMQGYEESPWAKNMTKRGIEAAEAAASRSGTLGSTNFSREVSDHASNTSQMDMQTYLNNIMGINQQKMGAQGNAIGFTNQAPYQQSSNFMQLAQILPQLFSQLGNSQAEMGKEVGESRMGREMAGAKGITGMLGMIPGLGKLFS